MSSPDTGSLEHEAVRVLLEEASRRREEDRRQSAVRSTKRAQTSLRVARQLAHHERGKAVLLVPVAWLAALHAAAWLFTLGLNPLIRAGLILAAAAVVLGRAERSGRDLPWAPVGAGVAWMTTASLLSPHGWVVLVLWAVGLAASVPFWVGVLRRPARAPQREIEAPSARVGREAALWAERVVPNNPAYKLTHLAEVEPVPDGYSGIIVGEPGPTKYSKMSAADAMETIASANRVRPSQVAVEEVDDGDASRARVTVIRSDQNLTATAWLEDSGAAIDPQTGIAQIGRYFDLAPAHRQFWTTSSGAQMGVIAGDTGSGKSNHVSGLLALAHRCPLVATALLDPQSGSSQPDWSGRTLIYGEGHEATYAYLQMLDYVMVRRADYVAHAPWADAQGRERRGKPFLLPGDADMGGMSMLMVCVEELKLFLDGPYGKLGFDLLSTGVRTWRKAGGSLLVVNQNLGLDNFANSQSFRSNLISGGSLTALRTGSSTDHQMVGLPADPSKLPEYFRDGTKTHGLGYTAGVDRRPAATLRMMPVRDAFGIASTPPAGQLGQRTLGYMEEWRHKNARGRTPETAARPSTPRHTSGDVQAAVEQVLAGAGKPLEVGTVCVAVQRAIGDVQLAEVPAALRALVRGDVVQQRGDLYQLIAP